ncbi:MAG: hypothetical protein QNL88_17040 [Acidobacteriota bacterium]|nr:hypothetical protein [Acidobacteriota bacterium]
MDRNLVVSCLVGALLAVTTAQAKEEPTPGLIAVSAGESVELVDPATGAVRAIPSGPVAWLFPAPGGTLFAPDLVGGTTTVIDLTTQTSRERLDGVTMPHFGSRPDRYVVVASQLLVVSYPERALMNSFEIAFHNPWQVAVIAEDSVLLVLERHPSGNGQTAMVAVNLGDGRMVYRRPLVGDVRHFALSPALAVIALGDASSDRVVLTDPATLTTQADFAVGGSPVDLVFVDTGSTLVVASERPDGGGELVMWKIKFEKKHGLVKKKEWRIPLEGQPVRLAASPDERYVAVALAEGRVQIIDVDSREIVQSAVLNAAPRDIVWCDPSLPGPILPEWTDDDPPTLDLGPKTLDLGG